MAAISRISLLTNPSPPFGAEHAADSAHITSASLPIIQRAPIPQKNNIIMLGPTRNSELFRRLPDKEYNGLLQTASKTPECTQSVIDAFKRGDWSHPVFRSDNWIDYAVKAYLSYQIDQAAFIRSALYQSCCSESTEEVICKQALQPDGRPSASFIQLKEAMSDYLTDAQWALFAEQFKDHPEKTQFFLIHPNSVSKSIRSMIGVINEALFDGNRNFLTTTDSSKKMLVIPTPELFEALLKIKHPDAYDFLCIGGYSPVENFTNNVRRTVRIPIPGVSCPSHLHEEIPSTDLTFLLHDYYHHLIADSMRKETRDLWFKIATFVKNRFSNQQTAIKCFRTIIDLDMPVYALDNQSLALKFWETVALHMPKEAREPICLYVAQNAFLLKEQFGISVLGLHDLAYEDEPSRKTVFQPQLQELFKILVSQVALMTYEQHTN